jgi:L-lactate utilization protein LutC
MTYLVTLLVECHIEVEADDASDARAEAEGAVLCESRNTRAEVVTIVQMGLDEQGRMGWMKVEE